MDSSFQLDDSASLFLSAVLKIGFGLAIFITITFIVWIYYFRNYVAEHIDEYKCKPYIMPIINFFDNEVDTSKNFRTCLGVNQQSYFNTATQPIVDATGSVADTMTKAAEAVSVLTDGVMHVGSVMQNKVEASNSELDKLNSVFVYFLMKIKSVFDKVGGLLNDAYGGLQSIMDTANIVLVLPEMVMKIFGFLVMLFTVIIALLISMFVLNYTLGTAFTALGASLLPIPFTSALGAIWVALGGTLITYVALGVYMSAVIITTVVLGLILAIYIPIKQHFEAASRSSYCCFSSDTPIKIHSGKYVPISSILLGERISGGDVHGILYSKMKNVEIDDWVKVKSDDNDPGSGLVFKSHKVFTDTSLQNPVEIGNLLNKKMVEKNIQFCSMSEDDTYRLRNKEKWCLVTTNHRIESVNGLLFTDYQELEENSDELVSLASSILHRVNPLFHEDGRIQEGFEHGEMNFGFMGDILVYLEDNQTKKVKDIQVGDILLGHKNEVEGIYICSSTESYRPSIIHGTEVSPQQIFSCDKTPSKWIKAYMFHRPEERRCHLQKCTLYHFVTSAGSFTICSQDMSGMKVLDFVSNGTLD